MLRQYFAERSSIAKRIEIRFAASIWVMLALLVMVLPLGWLVCAVIAAVVHECGHLLAALLLNVNIVRVEIRGFGVRILTSYMPPYKEMLVSLAGPLAGMSLVLLYKQSLVLSIFAFGQTVFNLLPILPFDGGRVIVSLYRMLFIKRNVNTFRKVLSYISIGLYGVLLVAFMRPFLGLSGIAILVFMYLKNYTDNDLDKYFLRGKLIKKPWRNQKDDLPEISSEPAVSYVGKQWL